MFLWSQVDPASTGFGRAENLATAQLVPTLGPWVQDFGFGV